MDGLKADTKLINDLIEWSGKNATTIAGEIGTAVTTITRPANGKATTRIGRKTLDALQAAFPSFPGWSGSTGKPEPRTPSVAPRSDHPPTRSIDGGEAVPVIALDLSLSMGPGTLIEDFVEAEPVLLDLALLHAITRTPTDRLRLVRGIGHSMEPTLRTDDRVLIDINDRGLAALGGVYWIDYLGAHGIKRLRPAGKGRVLIMSDNPVEPSFEVDASDVRIEGRAIWFARGL